MCSVALFQWRNKRSIAPKASPAALLLWPHSRVIIRLPASASSIEPCEMRLPETAAAGGERKEALAHVLPSAAGRLPWCATRNEISEGGVCRGKGARRRPALSAFLGVSLERAKRLCYLAVNRLSRLILAVFIWSGASSLRRRRSRHDRITATGPTGDVFDGAVLS